MSILMESEYIGYWEKYTNLKDKTKENYRTAYRRFGQYLEKAGLKGTLDFDKFVCDIERTHFDPIDNTFIDEFIEDLLNNGATKAILANTISALRHLFAFLKSMKLINKNPLLYYKNPYYNRSVLNKWLTNDEVEKLLNAALRMDPFIKQSYLLIFLLVNTGLRNQETRELQIDQIDFDRATLYVSRGQKTSSNSVRLSETLTEELAAYVKHPFNQARFKEGNTYLFIQSNGQRLTTKKDLNNWIESICEAAGVQRVTSHWLRYTMAHLMLEQGIHPRIIQRQLRHELLETTLNYLGIIDFDGLLDE
ncbi:site-specific integrase [Paenibacillus sp. R14(2021)]|uniref:tyrosine-type recombinase/integrase n=1 Tax=Paenibacillus sp. R14(2021) TaxID=2859228 RepID=UPI001C613C0C|nr:site-specific integrase [Paenibacillus sp. R14(2021)]